MAIVTTPANTPTPSVPLSLLVLLLLPTVWLAFKALPLGPSLPPPMLTRSTQFGVEHAESPADSPLESDGDSAIIPGADSASIFQKPIAPVERLERKSPPAGVTSTSRKVSPGNDLIDLNTADTTTLQSLPGIGPVLAGRIIATREERPFERIEDIRRVSGIGVKRLEQMRPLVRIGP